MKMRGLRRSVSVTGAAPGMGRASAFVGAGASVVLADF